MLYEDDNHGNMLDPQGEIQELEFVRISTTYSVMLRGARPAGRPLHRPSHVCIQHASPGQQHASPLWNVATCVFCTAFENIV